MSREGWIVAIGACLLLLIVPLAMCSGLSPDKSPRNQRQRPPDEPESEGAFLEPEESAEGAEGGAHAVAPDPPETPLRTVSGEITDATGAPIQDATVALEGAEGVQVTSDAEGSFELAGLPSADLVLVITAFGYSETLADVPTGTSEHDVVMGPSNDVTGKVLDPDGKPLAGAFVKCVTSARPGVQSDQQGRFIMKAHKGCDAAASHGDYATSAHVELKPGPDNFLALQTLGSIKGVVVDPNGAAFRGFVLSLSSFEPADPRAKMRPYRQTFAHPQGRFQITKLRAGTYIFNVGLRGRGNIRTRPIKLKSGEQLKDVRVVVPDA